MKLLAIESSCDETSAAVVELVTAKSRGVHHEPSTNSSEKASGKRLGIEKIDNKIIVHSNITATSLAIHATTGGIIPENAAREQVKYIIPVIREALLQAGGTGGRAPDTRAVERKRAATFGKENPGQDPLKLLKDIDAIAVTYGPGLIGSLLVGVETAKTLSFALDKPIIPVNHLLAHIFANFISSEDRISKIEYPFIGLIVSGGHTDLLYFESIEKFKWLGGTRDDAAGEALDKIGRLLGLPYPAGPEIERRAKLATKTKLRFHSPMLGEDTFDFSFSGLKTEVGRHLQSRGLTLEEAENNEVCYAVQKAVIDVLVRKTLKAAEKYACPTILLGGGVSANKALMEQFKVHGSQFNVYAPERKYCTDNAAMIGAYALLNPEKKSWNKIFATPDLYFY